MGGRGEYYLVRDKYAKGGFKWIGDGGDVKGYEFKKRQSDTTYEKRIRRKYNLE